MKPFRTVAKATVALTTVALSVLAFTACSNSTDQAGDSHTGEQKAAQKAPETIAALDYESAEVLASLGLGKHVVMMPEATMNPVLGSHQKDLGHVKDKIKVTADLDPESVIDVFPDLAIISPRHGAEKRFNGVLEDAGVKTLALPNSWGSLDEITQNITLIGKSTGTKAEAAKLVKKLKSGLGSEKKPGSDAPHVMVLTNQAGRPFITAGDAMPLDLLNRAGATSASEDLHAKVTGPVSSEQLIEADPDGIVLIDMNGSGDKLYKSLLANDAVSSLDAVKNNKILRVEGKQVQALGLTNMIDGLDALKEFVNTLN
jgi:iron complex transport system substrate-binding protein